MMLSPEWEPREVVLLTRGRPVQRTTSRAEDDLGSPSQGFDPSHTGPWVVVGGRRSTTATRARRRTPRLAERRRRRATRTRPSSSRPVTWPRRTGGCPCGRDSGPGVLTLPLLG